MADWEGVVGMCMGWRSRVMSKGCTVTVFSVSGRIRKNSCTQVKQRRLAHEFGDWALLFLLFP